MKNELRELKKVYNKVKIIFYKNLTIKELSNQKKISEKKSKKFF